MNPMFHRVLGWLTAGFLLLVTATANAGEGQAFVQSKHDALSASLKAPASPAQDKKIEAMLDELLDFDRMATESLGTHAEGKSSEQLGRFKTTLRDLVKKSYRKNIKKTIAYEITYTGETQEGQGLVLKTRATKRGGQPIEVNYWLHKVNGKWMIWDVETEGSRMVSNYKRQFNKVIKRDGFDALLGKMKKKLD